MRTAHARDNAKAAGMITALGNLHISKMIRREPEARRLVIWNVNGAAGDIEQRGDRLHFGMSILRKRLVDDRKMVHHLFLARGSFASGFARQAIFAMLDRLVH